MTTSQDFNSAYQTIVDALRSNREAHHERDTAVANATKEYKEREQGVKDYLNEEQKKAESARKLLQQELDNLFERVKQLARWGESDLRRSGISVEDLSSPVPATIAQSPKRGLKNAFERAEQELDMLRLAQQNLEQVRAKIQQKKLVFRMVVFAAIAFVALSGYWAYQELDRLAKNQLYAKASTTIESLPDVTGVPRNCDQPCSGLYWIDKSIAFYFTAESGETINLSLVNQSGVSGSLSLLNASGNLLTYTQMSSDARLRVQILLSGVYIVLATSDGKVGSDNHFRFTMTRSR